MNERSRSAVRTLSVGVLTAAACILAAIALYQTACYLGIRVDLLSYSESGYVNDLLRMELGLPIYAPPVDNESTVYTPGSQILTYAIARATGVSDDIPALRWIQFSYVVLAIVLAVLAFDRLARIAVAAGKYRPRALWIACAGAVFVLVAFEPRFNPYTQSLNSDGLALAVSMLGFLLMTLHAGSGSARLLVPMAVLPAAGFFVKQNLIAWAGFFTIYLAISGLVSWRRLATFVTAAGVLIAAAFAAAYAAWGDNFWFWTITSYEPKAISIARSVQHLLDAGAYAALGLAGGLVVLSARPSRPVAAVWIAGGVMLLLHAYTSGFAWAHNHLGPSVMLAACWGLLLAVTLWPSDPGPSPAMAYARLAIAPAVFVCALGGLGLVREPRNPVPPDLQRYVEAIEREFEGLDERRVLMDYGTWIYLRERVPMKDRGYAVHVHLEPNQEISHDQLAESIARIRAGVYDKILVRQLDEGRSSYDFLLRGSGLREAILERYCEVRRIPEVRGVRVWWPRHMLSEIQVFERRPDTLEATGSDRPVAPPLE